ncbi:MAG: transposase [Leptospiraceae bacterium]|nr:transposase [Leptospiraceae bacterium]
MRKRRNYDPLFRSKVAIEAIKGNRTLAQISSEYKVHSNLIVKWKKEAINKFPMLFSAKGSKDIEEEKELTESLYKEIGKLKMEVEFLKKKLLN